MPLNPSLGPVPFDITAPLPSVLHLRIADSRSSCARTAYHASSGQTHGTDYVDHIFVKEDDHGQVFAIPDSGLSNPTYPLIILREPGIVLLIIAVTE